MGLEKVLEALKHAETRLNQISHKYEDTNFRLISEGVKEAEHLAKTEGATETLRMRNALIKMRDIYAEKRSDVSDMCQAIREGKEPRKEDAEHRYVEWTFEDRQFSYDTLTTLVEVDLGEEIGWVQIDGIEYKDDE